MTKFLTQLKERRIHLQLRQSDMLLTAGMSRQQYQQLESKGNPRLDTIELLAEALSCELMLIPKEKLIEIKAILDDDPIGIEEDKDNEIINNPWQDFLGNTE